MPQQNHSSFLRHSAILLSNNIDKSELISRLMSGQVADIPFLNDKKGMVFSDQAIQEIMAREERHDLVLVAISLQRKLKTFSSGERKKLYLEHCLSQNPHFLILDNPLDHLDSQSRRDLKEFFSEIKENILLIQLAHRNEDILSFFQLRWQIDAASGHLMPLKKLEDGAIKNIDTDFFSLLHNDEHKENVLIELHDVSIAYGEKKVLHNISWTIKHNEFWQLLGPNGSGKSSLLALITGDNVKGYGQEVYLFGTKKGSGESVWEIKKKIGYFSMAVLDLFRNDQSAEEMIISGFYDSIGLYVKPTDLQKKTAKQWLKGIGLGHVATKHFSKLTPGEQRVVLIIRAVVKNPPLILLDEPVEGLDEHNAQQVIRLINMLVRQTTMAVVFISHRLELALEPAMVFELVPSPEGSKGTIVNKNKENYG